MKSLFFMRFYNNQAEILLILPIHLFSNFFFFLPRCGSLIKFYLFPSPIFSTANILHSDSTMIKTKKLTSVHYYEQDSSPIQIAPAFLLMTFICSRIQPTHGVTFSHHASSVTSLSVTLSQSFGFSLP